MNKHPGPAASARASRWVTRRLARDDAVDLSAIDCACVITLPISTDRDGLSADFQSHRLVVHRFHFPHIVVIDQSHDIQVIHTGMLHTTAPQHHNTTTPPHHSTTAPSHHRTIAPQHHRTTAPQHHSTTTPQHHSTTAPSHHNTTTPPHHNTTASQHHRTIAPQHHNTTASQHHRTTAPPHHRTTTPQQHNKRNMISVHRTEDILNINCNTQVIASAYFQLSLKTTAICENIQWTNYFFTQLLKLISIKNDE